MINSNQTAIKNFKDSGTYKQCQKSLLLTEVNMKRSHLRVLRKDFGFLPKELQTVFNCIDFTHICSLFVAAIAPL